MEFEAVIFDMDGVIVDNKEYHDAAWEQFAVKYSQSTIPDFKAWLLSMTGRTTAAMLESLFGTQLTSKEITQYESEKEQLYRQLYKNHVLAIKGLERFLNILQEIEIPFSIATSGSIENIQFILSETELTKYFKHFVDAQMVKKGKPDPEVYLKAAQILNTNPEKCLVFEDSIAGIQSALAAGMTVVGVSTTHSAKQLYNAGVSFVIDDFSDETLLRSIIKTGKA